MVGFVMKGLLRLSFAVFFAAIPYWSWLFRHRPHVPEGVYTAKPILGQTMYLLPWECTLLNWLVLGSWALGAVTSLACKGLYPDEDMDQLSKALFGIGFVLSIGSAWVIGQS